jgi:hypothetical protein
MEQEKTEQEKYKEKAMKSKLIGLDLMGKHPLTNPSGFSERDKRKLLKHMEEWFNKPDAELEAEFNDVVLDKVLGIHTDYTGYRASNPEIIIPEIKYHRDLPPLNVEDIIGKLSLEELKDLINPPAP